VRPSPLLERLIYIAAEYDLNEVRTYFIKRTLMYIDDPSLASAALRVIRVMEDPAESAFMDLLASPAEYLAWLSRKNRSGGGTPGAQTTPEGGAAGESSAGSSTAASPAVSGGLVSVMTALPEFLMSIVSELPHYIDVAVSWLEENAQPEIQISGLTGTGETYTSYDYSFSVTEGADPQWADATVTGAQTMFAGGNQSVTPVANLSFLAVP